MLDKIKSVYLNYALRQLKSLAERNCLPHAIMLFGDVQQGYNISREFARYLFCDLKSSNGCQCKSCSLFFANNHPDFFLVDLGSDQEIKIDLIREVNKFISSGTYLANKKIILINNFHNINNQSANAMLKNLEEPSINTEVLFLLITNNSNILPATILSRVFQYNILLHHDNKITKYQFIKGFTDKHVELLKDLYNVWVEEDPNSLSLIEKWNSWSKQQLIDCLWVIMTNMIKLPLEQKSIGHPQEELIHYQLLRVIKQKISSYTQWQLLDSLNYINKLFILGYQINLRLFLYNFIMTKFTKRNIYARATRS